MIDQIVREANKIVGQTQASGKTDKRVLAVAVEINQLYLEYLEELETMPFHIQNGVRVEVDGRVIQFKDVEDFSKWITGQ